MCKNTVPKTLFRLQIAAEIYQTTLVNYLLNGTQKTTLGMFEILKVEVLTIFKIKNWKQN